MIYYFCYDNQRPTGGSAVIYRHVNLLIEAGLPAAVVHQRTGFVLPGYEQDHPPLVGSLDLNLQDSDLLVMPGDLGPALNRLAPGIRKVIFNQNAYHSFRGYEISHEEIPPYLHPDFVGVLVVSEDNRRYLEAFFPGARVSRVHISFDLESFFCSDLACKQQSIALMIRKNQADAVQVVMALKSRGVLDGWSFRLIHDLPASEVAKVMQASAIYMSFGYPEGISLSNLEAMIAVCKVVGYSGMGCREYFDGTLCVETPFGDIVSFVEAVEHLAQSFEDDRHAFDRGVLAAQAYVRDTHSAEREKSELLAFYDGILRSQN